ncbi:MAG: FxsA family protein [Acidobacteriota bacterium]
MLWRLTLLFVAVPLVELALLVFLGQRVGIVPTVLLVIATGVLGASLARYQGLATLASFRQAVEAGRPPHQELAQGALLLAAGAVLLTPGLLTDIAGFSLLVPRVRRWAGRRLVRMIGRRFQRVQVGKRVESRGDAPLDVEWEVVDDEPS